ncbi:nitrate reductase molybdenum cofactor assembly chaperone [Streptomyces diacarni]|uniref:Nitrate reductase molybdenum cofactor assembly chaperone n=1 Tax=Streptomyces diacarni TaxID=2800381 RepID=A0A367EW62_9ACTN|nr:nitrate reductase molybdenum cofactor assembly chaperone [Streptomyces diacarni]RCG21400.1 nitrate reductase molybdenum cofactor assembly chaperone [Streptomyces diacarni]
MTTALVHQAASLLLGYPDENWPERVLTVETTLSALPPGACPQAADVLRFCHEVADVPALRLASRYVATFDRSRRRTLHLTYYSDGDTRRRGASLAALKALMRRHGWAVPEGELPDHLPDVLEFAARCPDPGVGVLTEHRAGLTLLTKALTGYRSPYAAVLHAVCETLPAPAPADRAAVRALAHQGPPAETVGLGPGPLVDLPAPLPHTEGARR